VGYKEQKKKKKKSAQWKIKSKSAERRKDDVFFLTLHLENWFIDAVYRHQSSRVDHIIVYFRAWKDCRRGCIVKKR